MNPGLPLPCPSARPRGASAHARQGVHLRFSTAVVLTAIQGEADGATGWGQLCRRAPADTQIPFEAIEAGVHHGRPLGWPVDPVGPTVTLLLRTLGIAQSAVAEGDLMSNAELGQRVGSSAHVGQQAMTSAPTSRLT